MIRTKIERPHRILVVDDQEVNRDALGITLEEYYEVVYAENGREALDIIEASLNDISLVMLDLMMPVMDGFAVLDAMRKDHRMRTIPVIVLTAEKSAELQALEMGAADFITKPFDMPEIILARVSRMIELNDGRNLISAAEHDPLTGLYSRNFFFEYASRIFRYHPELHFDALVLNIEKFHSVNALTGRDFGDEVLRTIGTELRAYLAESSGIASRTEADHFDIYCAQPESYQGLLNRLQESVNRIRQNVSIRLRMGVKPWTPDADPVLSFDHARAACKLVRGDFQNPLMIYDEEMRRKELYEQRLLNDLQAAVEEQQFEVYYQPKYDIQSKTPRLRSAEALIRWNHPELGMISPGAFIPLFESHGLISIVDNFVWRETARQIAEWRKTYGTDLAASVNLSRADVFDPTLVERLVTLMQENNLNYKDIKLEVTESAYTDNAKQLLDVIHELRKAGFDIEMDDFGSGYSSLNMLSEMPIDVLKMDMKFIRNIEQNETDHQLVRLIVDMAKYLGVPVVAEGVETQGQLELLKNAGCDLVQGYYFSKPVPASEFETLIEKDRTIDKEGVEV